MLEHDKIVGQLKSPDTLVIILTSAVSMTVFPEKTIITVRLDSGYKQDKDFFKQLS